MACLNHKRKRSRQSQAHDEHQPITEIKSQQPAFRTHTRILDTCSSAPDELAQLSLSGCSFEDTLDRNYFRSASFAAAGRHLSNDRRSNVVKTALVATGADRTRPIRSGFSI